MTENNHFYRNTCHWSTNEQFWLFPMVRPLNSSRLLQLGHILSRSQIRLESQARPRASLECSWKMSHIILSIITWKTMSAWLLHQRNQYQLFVKVRFKIKSKKMKWVIFGTKFWNVPKTFTILPIVGSFQKKMLLI